MPILAGEGVLSPDSNSPKETLEYKWRRQKDQPISQERPETDFYPPIEEATSQERPNTGHSGLYSYEDWMAQAVRSMENYLNSEDNHTEVEERDKDNEKILYKMVDGAYQRTLLRKDDAEVRQINLSSSAAASLTSNHLIFRFHTPWSHPHQCQR